MTSLIDGEEGFSTVDETGSLRITIVVGPLLSSSSLRRCSSRASNCACSRATKPSIFSGSMDCWITTCVGVEGAGGVTVVSATFGRGICVGAADVEVRPADLSLTIGAVAFDTFTVAGLAQDRQTNVLVPRSVRTATVTTLYFLYERRFFFGLPPNPALAIARALSTEPSTYLFRFCFGEDLSSAKAASAGGAFSFPTSMIRWSPPPSPSTGPTLAVWS